MPSEAWKYFTKLTFETAICKECSASIKSCGNTTNLMAHLRSKHPMVIKVNEDIPSKQPKINDCISEINSIKSGAKAKIIEDALVWYISNNFQAFNIVEDLEFRRLFKVIIPSFSMPSRKKISGATFKMYQNKKELVTTHLKTINYISITTDLWTDGYNSKSYIGVTGHFIDNYRCTSLCLAVKDMEVAHTTNNIVTNILEILCDFEIPTDKLTTIVTDGAANVTSATKQIVNDPIWCVAHRLNLIVNNTISECNDASALICQVRNIVKLFKQSNNFSDILRKIQSSDGQTPLKLKQDVCTRWNSTYIMLERFNALRNFVSIALIKVNRADLDIPFGNIEVLCDVQKLLEPFFAVTKDLSGEQYCTVSRVIPVLNMLKHRVLNLNVQSSVGKAFQGILCMNLNERFGSIEQDKNFAYATILDRRFKQVDFASPACCAKAIDEINKMLRHVPLTQTTVVPVECDSLWELHEKRVQQLSNDSDGSGLNIGLKHYLKMVNLPRDADPLEFWRKNKENWHELHNLAIKYLTTPATSVPCERLFSCAGNTITDKRNSLKPKNVNALCFLHSLPEAFRH
ncbi:zinc finger BED domain-containing protein 4-like isoform X1 [Tetranychus urticae]|uniref:BED-type domain-containing protein n=1 Tax=Tetranychus urticae TaxID=32264 RepID=T1JXM7_TETUR|nr:zinc finger BED domain-containing protein 4-like isoform X1 [Tetranychus urticae]XP_025018544.1 zinc finger BED domain-containing protein 4-like isoform X1 [Tetranychus urticae]XP_025018545.1 zinc finger BED domain-containing protein 4-like isoform X1 [Tetranychus urticae]